MRAIGRLCIIGPTMAKKKARGSDRSSGRAKVRGYTLLDAEAWAAMNPGTFQIPDAEVRARLLPPEGDQNTVLAKLVFQSLDGTADERMWVRVIGRRGGSYVGLLDNHPDDSMGLSLGDEVTFSPRNVIDVDISRPSGDGGFVATLLEVLRGW